MLLWWPRARGGAFGFGDDDDDDDGVSVNSEHEEKGVTEEGGVWRRAADSIRVRVQCFYFYYYYYFFRDFS